MLNLSTDNGNGVRIEACITTDHDGNEVMGLMVTTKYANGRRSMRTVIATDQCPTQEALARTNQAIDGVTASLQDIRSIVGNHNYYHISVFKAQELVQACCPEGWAASADIWHSIPNGAVRVGQVKVRAGDPEFALYVYPVPNQ